jgi:hypothetical protein
MSNSDDERAPDGSRILRYEPPKPGFTPAAATSSCIEEIEKHFATFFGKPTTVFHEIVSDLVHIDVHIIPPQPKRDYWTLFTTGMSDLPMTPPEGADDQKYAELMLSLPPNWKIDQLQVTPPPADLERWYWPIRWLKQLARFPHTCNTWLASGHTIPNGDPAEPFTAGTKLCCWLLLPPVRVSSAARTIHLSDGRTVRLFALHALHLEEVSLKLNKGLDALLEAFDRANVGEVLTIDRPSSVRKKLFGLF